MPAVALFLCNRTLIMPRPWLDADIECWLVDLQFPRGESREGNTVRVGADVLTWLPPRRSYLFACAFTDCTDLAVSGALWFKAKGLRALSQAAALASRCAEICEWTGAPYFVENPVSTLSTYWREPDYIFNPCDFGDPYNKKTCLWTGGGFAMPRVVRPGNAGLFGSEPATSVAPTLGSKMHLLPPSPDRKNLRSETPPGFARAVFQANAPAGLMRETAWPPPATEPAGTNERTDEMADGMKRRKADREFLRICREEAAAGETVVVATEREVCRRQPLPCLADIFVLAGTAECCKLCAPQLDKIRTLQGYEHLTGIFWLPKEGVVTEGQRKMVKDAVDNALAKWRRETENFTFDSDE